MKSRDHLRPRGGAVNRGILFGFFAAEKTTYGVRRLCRILGISPTSFYAWVTRAGGPTAAELEEAYAIEASRPEARSALPNSYEVYWLPRSVWCTVPAAGRRLMMAMPTASSTSSVRR